MAALPLPFIAAPVIIVLALTLPLRDILAIPLWSSLFALIALLLGIRSILRAPRRISPSHRRRHGLATLSFTTPSAWSAVQTRQEWENTAPTANTSSTKDTRLSSRLDEIFRLIKISFILPWYNRISPSPAFPNAVETLIRQALDNLVLHRAQHVDWSHLLVSKIVPIITEHVHHYRTVEHLSSTSSLPTNPSLPLPLPLSAHPALKQEVHISSKTPLIQIEEHFRTTLDRIVDDILPESRNALVVRTIVREIVLGSILLPVFEMLCDSDFWNRQIDERGAKYIHEQKQVNRLLSALSTLPPPSSNPSSRRNSPLRAKTIPATTNITAMSSTRDTEAFLKSIAKVKTLGEARRLRADIERTQRHAQAILDRRTGFQDGDKDSENEVKRAKKFLKRMNRARNEVDARIRVLAVANPTAVGSNDARSSNDPSRPAAQIDLHVVLGDPSTLPYWLEYMERRGRSRLVQFWLTIEGFKDPLDPSDIQGGYDAVSPSPVPANPPNNQTIREDLALLNDMYFANSDFDIASIGLHAQTIRRLAQLETLSAVDVRHAKRAMFACQQAIYEQMLEEDWDGFERSELFIKASSDLTKSTFVNPRSIMASPDLSSSMILPTSPPGPPVPVRLHTAPLITTKKRVNSTPLSPATKAFPSLINGYFSPKAATPSASISITTPFFARGRSSVNSGLIIGSSDATVDLSASTGSLSPTPGGLTRRPTQLDSLMDLTDDAEATERRKLFEDEDDETLDPEEEDFVQVERMEAIQAALNDIIAGDDLNNSRTFERNSTPGGETSRSPSSSMILVPKAESTEPLGKMVSRSVEDLRSHPQRPSSSAPHSRVPSFKPAIPHRSSSSELRSKGKVLFDDVPQEEEHQEVDFDDQSAMRNGVLSVVQLRAETARLQARIQELVKQDHMLEGLIRQAELTGDAAKLQILNRSQISVRREQRTAIFQKAQYEQEEEQSRLVPGQTDVSIPTAVVMREDGDGGKEFVKYTINVRQKGESEVAWNVLRRFNEFWELDKALRDWANRVGLTKLFRGVEELPSKKLVPDLSPSFVEKRRKGLEKYLHSLLCSPQICETDQLRNFLSRSSISLDQASLASSSTFTSLAPHDLARSIYRTITTTVDDTSFAPGMIDMMATTLSRQFADLGEIVGMGAEEIAALGSTILPQALRTAWAKDDRPVSPNRVHSSAAPITSPGEASTGSFTAPLCDILDELFDLKEGNWFRRQVSFVFLQQVVDGRIERKIRDTVEAAISASSVEKGLTSFQEMLWPGGVRRPPTSPRTEEEKIDSRYRATRNLAALVPDFAASVLGSDNARRGLRRAFGALQDKRLNQQLLLCILDEILGALFPALQQPRK